MIQLNSKSNTFRYQVLSLLLSITFILGVTTIWASDDTGRKATDRDDTTLSDSTSDSVASNQPTEEVSKKPSILNRMTIGVKGGINLGFPVFQTAIDPRALPANNYEITRKLMFSTTLHYQFRFHKFVSGLFELGYAHNGWDTTSITLKDTNIQNMESNLYIDPFDLTEKYGALGEVRREMLTFGLLAKGHYPIRLGEFTLSPYLATGGQLDLILTTQYAINNYGAIDYLPFTSHIDINIPVALGAEFDLGYGSILLDVRFLFHVTKRTEQIIYSNSNLSYPIDFTVPTFHLHQFLINLGYTISLDTLIDFFKS